MDSVIINNNIESFSSAILVASEKEINEIEKEIDKIFYDYSFYPEEEWVVYDCKPPDGYQVLGAWRHPFITSYAFLLNNSGREKIFSNIQLIICIKADKKHIHTIISRLHKLKFKYSFKDIFLDERIDRIHKLKAPAFMISLLGAFTAIINAFSLYIMKIPEPMINNTILKNIYNSLISIFHVLAILFLINFCLICIFFLTKYGLLIVRKV
jgi:hypothetical protein